MLHVIFTRKLHGLARLKKCLKKRCARIIKSNATVTARDARIYDRTVEIYCSFLRVHLGINNYSIYYLYYTIR